MPAIIEFEAVTKRFPGVIALADVTFGIARGECHALVGENGAGKSTLGKIAAGIYRPDAGRVVVDGRPVRFGGPLDAVRAGIGIVHQELAYCPNLSVAENLCLGRLPSRAGVLCRGELADRAVGMLGRIGADIDPQLPMGLLSTAQVQLVQIAAAVGTGARVLILDEPTSSLSAGESDRLARLLEQLRDDGTTIVYVSHRLEEVFRLADRITVLRDGRHVATLERTRTSPPELVRLMIGRPLEEYFPQHLREPPGPERLAVEGFSSPGRFEDVSLAVHAGEVVGLAGLVGSGRSELAAAIFGLDPRATGRVRVEGRPVSIRDPRHAIALGIGYLPEDRKTQGLVLSLGGRANISLPSLKRLAIAGFVRQRRERELAAEYFERLRVRAPDMDVPTLTLSGGNQQKIALAKWLASRCRVLIMDEPTRGVDIGAKAEIHALIDQLAAAGAGVLLISSELPEVLNLSTRIVVLRRGRVAGEMPRRQTTAESLMRCMAGLTSSATARVP